MKCRRYLGFHPVLFCLPASLAGFLMATGPVSAAVKVREIITAEEAQQRIGQTCTVCGFVAGARYADTAPNKPTYLNLERPYPNQAFTAVIPGALRALHRFRPEEYYKGKTICVTGQIAIHRDKPQIMIDDPFQIRIEQPASPTINQPPVSTNQTIDSTSPAADSTNQPTDSTSE